MADGRNENRQDVTLHLSNAEDSLSARGWDSESEPTFQDHVLSESYDWRKAFVHVGGAISTAVLDLADAIRSKRD